LQGENRGNSFEKFRPVKAQEFPLTVRKAKQVGIKEMQLYYQEYVLCWSERNRYHKKNKRSETIKEVI
jgi:hypothetical protein